MGGEAGESGRGRTIGPPGVEGCDEDGAGVLEVDCDAAEAKEEVISRGRGDFRP